MRNNFYLILGESGSGKDTMVNEICRLTGAKKLLSYTTRTPRPNENGTHLFISKNDFDGLAHKVARTCYMGNYYCATEEQVNESDIYIIDPSGLEFFKHAYRGDKQLVVIRVKCPMLTRFKRMLKRGDSFLGAMRRIANDAEEFAHADEMADIITTNKFRNLEV